MNILLISWNNIYFSTEEIIRFNIIAIITTSGLFFSEYLASSTLNKLNESVSSIKELNLSLKTISRTDSLTGLQNRRSFDETFDKQRKIASRKNDCLAFAMIDIDYFKRYNDTYGHKAGDDALITVANKIKQSLSRPDDFSFRLGGEEFGILFSAKDKKSAKILVNKTLTNVECLHILHENSGVSSFITISIGLYMIEPDSKLSNDEIYKLCDNALYDAKQNGRNQINVYRPGKN